MEADNLCCWYGPELAAVELVLCISQSKSLHVTTITTNGIPDEIFFLPLQHRHEQLLTLSLWWSSPLASKSCFDTHTQDAMALAIWLTHGAPEISLSWITPIIVESPDTSAKEWQIDFQPNLEMEPTLEAEDLLALDYLIEAPSIPLAEVCDSNSNNNNDRPCNSSMISITIVWSVLLIYLLLHRWIFIDEASSILPWTNTSPTTMSRQIGRQWSGGAPGASRIAQSLPPHFWSPRYHNVSISNHLCQWCLYKQHHPTASICDKSSPRTFLCNFFDLWPSLCLLQDWPQTLQGDEAHGVLDQGYLDSTHSLSRSLGSVHC